MINTIIGLIVLVVLVFFIYRHMNQRALINIVGPCSEGWLGYHDFRYKPNWNSGKRSKFTNDLISRSGKRCYDCGEMIWDETDADFEQRIKYVVDDNDRQD